jgi:hypothetical protein
VLSLAITIHFIGSVHVHHPVVSQLNYNISNRVFELALPRQRGDPMTMITNEPGRPVKIFMKIIWWAGVIGLLFLAQARLEWFYHLFRDTFLGALVSKDLLDNDQLLLGNFITPIRGIIFLCSFAIVISPVVRDIYVSKSADDSRLSSRQVLELVVALLILCIVFTPGRIDGLAQEYSNSSFVFFIRAATLHYHQRFLMPILANILFFRGDFFFLIFSFICFVILVFVLRLWFHKNQVPVSTWQFVSLATMSFVYFPLSAPGYPDVLVSIFILAAFSLSLSTEAKLSLFTLSLVSHEASLIMWFALAWILLDKKGLFQLLVISAIYLIFWSRADNGILGILAGRQSGSISNLDWIFLSPVNEVLGIIFSFKALWGLVIGAIWYLFSRRNYKEALQIVLIVLAGLLMTFLGVDTSRLFGWAFMAILISWKVLAELEDVFWKKFLSVVLLINLLIPPVYVQLNLALIIPAGLYRAIADIISQLFMR